MVAVNGRKLKWPCKGHAYVVGVCVSLDVIRKMGNEEQRASNRSQKFLLKQGSSTCFMYVGFSAKADVYKSQPTPTPETEKPAQLLLPPELGNYP